MKHALQTLSEDAPSPAGNNLITRHPPPGQRGPIDRELLFRRDQIARGDAQRPRDRAQLQDREVSHAAFDTTHVGPVDSGFVGQRLLREAVPNPLLADESTNGTEKRIGPRWHGPMLGRCGLSVHGL